MAHDHNHSHVVDAHADRRYLAAGLALLVGYMLAEVVVAWWTGSLALLSDAAHMLTDAVAIALALWAIQLATKPASSNWTFGFKRAEILAALANGVTLLVLAGVLAYEGIRRLVEPPHVAAWPVLVVALAGVVINVIVAWLLAKANRSSLNVEGAYQHILTDLFGFIGTALAAIVILMTGWMRADAVATLVVVTLMVRAGWNLVSASGRVLLEAVPDVVRIEEVHQHLLELEHVIGLHDVHIWTVASDLPAMSAHLVVHDECFHDGHAPQLLDQAAECLRGHFDLAHSTLQLEPASHAAHEPGAHT